MENYQEQYNQELHQQEIRSNFAAFEKLYGIHYIIPDTATFATAIGAGLCSLRQKAVT